MAESRRPDRLRGAAIGAVAGAAAGILWGWAAEAPDLSYFSSLPGDIAENLYEILIQGASAFAQPPGRQAAFLLGHSVLGAVAGVLLTLVLRGMRGRLRPEALGAAAATIAVTFAFLVWPRRGISLDLPALAGVMVLVASLCGGVAWVCQRAGAHAWRAGGSALAFLAVGLLWYSRPLPLSEIRSDEPGPGSRLLIVGIDAASWSNLERGLELGELPNLAELRARGAAGDLQSLRITLSPVVWTTLLTGVEPSRHGIVDFARNGVPYSSNSRRAHALWEMLPNFGRRGAFHYWWASWPAEEVAGRIVTDRFMDRSLDQRTWPVADEPHLDRVADGARAHASSVLDLLDAPPQSGFGQRHREKVEVLDEILERDAIATALGVEAMQADFDVVATYLRGPDAVGHKFWSWHWHRNAPRRASLLFGPPDDDQAALGGLVDRVNSIVDEQVGELVSMTDPSWHIMLISDHGMTGSVTLGASPGDEAETGGHHRSGLILLAGPSIEPDARIRGASVYDVLPTALYLLGLPIPSDLPGRILSDAIRESVLRTEPKRVTGPLGARVIANTEPISTGGDDAYLDQLRALGYVIDEAAPEEDE